MKKKPLILVVDDNPHNLKVLGTILKKNGLNPAAANDGIKALEFIKRKQPDLILLDIMMPDMDGFEVCKCLKQDAKFSEIPIIFLSARTEKENVIKGLELGGVDYVTKPFNHQELLTRVNTHLELKGAKEALKQAVEKLEQANATKNKFFSIIAHDLGNVFNGLIGLSNLLITTPVDNVETMLPLFKQNSKKGYDLLINLLEWSRVQTGKMKATPKELDLKSLVYRNIGLLENQANTKQIKMVYDIENTLVFADEHMLNTVIRNLLSNAIKFTPEHGKVVISSKKEENWVEISISDTGIGIPAGDIEKLFRIDVSHSTRGTNNEQGTGLGLILCKEFVEKNNGTITIQSEEGKGSQFFIRLPQINST